jgi:phage gp29-like protein
MPKETLYQPRNLKIADKWRDYYNPLINLRVRLITTWLFDYQQGIVSNIQWLYRFVERRDATISAIIGRRTAAIKKLGWSIKTVPEKDLPEGFTAADAEAQKSALRENYARIDNIAAAIEWLALGQFRGYAHLEKHYNGDGDLCHLEPVPQWNWARAGLIGDWAYNRQALQVFWNPDAPDTQLTPIDRTRFVIREVSHPILEAIVINYIRKSMNQKDWDAFIETYGLPSVFIEVPGDAPVGTDGKLDPAYLEAAQGVASDARGVLPPGCKIVTVTGGHGGGAQNPFIEHIRYIDEQAVLAGTGGLLTMLAKSGSGTLAGEAHKDTFEELAEAEAAEISALFQCQIDKPILEERFPLQPALAYFQLAAPEATDTAQVVADAANLRTAGFQVDQAQLEAKTGYMLKPVAVPPSAVPAKPVIPEAESRALVANAA